jgi:hypothetical protein
MYLYYHCAWNHVTKDKDEDLGDRPGAFPYILDFPVQSEEVVIQQSLETKIMML